jgi:sigma-B regulation protein RsbU (phosphoserine phosphatase)
MSAEAGPSSNALTALPIGLDDWRQLLSAVSRETEDRAALEKTLAVWGASQHASRVALYAPAEGRHRLVAGLGAEFPAEISSDDEAPLPGLSRIALPDALLWHDAGERVDLHDPLLLLVLAGARILRLKRQVHEQRFQVNLRGVELEALYDVGLAIASTLDLERLGDEVLLRAVSLLDARRAALYLLENGAYRLLSRFGGEARTEIPTVEVDVRGLLDESAQPPADLLPDARHLLAMPVAIDGEPRGLLIFGDKESRKGVGPFAASDRRTLLLFANQAAIALENAKLHKLALEKERLEREMELASQIQKQLLPTKLPEILGYELAGWNRPARHIGGDFYGFSQLEGGQQSLTVADVTGKGMPAALLVSTLHSALRLLLDRVEAGPEFLERLNRHICEASQANKFITLIFTWIDPLSHRLTYLNAGHNPGVVLRARGGEVELPSSGPPLGIVPHARYKAATVDLEPGDLVCLYSDGITECEAPDDEQYGLDRLVHLLRLEEKQLLPDIIQAIDGTMVQFAQGRPQNDDQTVVLLRRRV